MENHTPRGQGSVELCPNLHFSHLPLCTETFSRLLPKILFDDRRLMSNCVTPRVVNFEYPMNDYSEATTANTVSCWASLLQSNHSIIPNVATRVHPWVRKYHLLHNCFVDKISPTPEIFEMVLDKRYSSTSLPEWIAKELYPLFLNKTDFRQARIGQSSKQLKQLVDM